ncbi:DUF6268 family outer membrane beta-barrel protein [Flavobacterium sp. FlaQc-52]|uniref:DUF6268 family outer membrane beta-barrel protein n=1 Tax=Flavobacterium sp. FlaQc-52 TaxID=3374185 RepID=UPI003757687B
MRTSSLLTLLVLLMGITQAKAQISIQTEYIGESRYGDEENNNIGNGKGSAIVYQATANIPISMKTNKDNLPVVWGVSLAGAYASLDNKNFTEELVVSDIVNASFSLYNMRPISKKWSLLTAVGAGVFTDQTQISKMGARNILGNAGVIFIKKINTKLDLGGGLAFNNSFGFPMVFPALYLSYNSPGRYVFNVSLLDGVRASAGYQLTDYFTLSIVGLMNGQMALTQRAGKEVIFTHQYMVGGLRPEFKINKHITIPITVGISGARPAYYAEKSLKSMFSTKDKFQFKSAPYAAVQVNYNF